MNNQNIFKFFKTALLVCICQITYGQEIIKSNKEGIVDSIPFQMTSHNNIVVSAVLNKTDTLNLMFHTAANSVSLTTKATKKIKNIHWDSQIELGSWGGRAKSRYSKNNTIEIGNVKKNNVTVWEDENSGPTTDGKFGLNFFEDHVIEIDFNSSIILLYEGLPEKVEGYLKMPLLNENGRFHIEAISSINGMEYRNQFLIHSGYGGTILYDDKFVADSKIGEQIKIIDEKELKDSFGKTLKIKRGVLPELKLGILKLIDVPVGFFEGKIGKQQMSVLGADVLKRFNLIIDSNRKYIYFKKNQLIDTNYTQF